MLTVTSMRSDPSSPEGVWHTGRREVLKTVGEQYIYIYIYIFFTPVCCAIVSLNVYTIYHNAGENTSAVEWATECKGGDNLNIGRSCVV